MTGDRLKLHGPELRIAPVDMARDIARRKGWPTIEPLRVEPTTRREQVKLAPPEQRIVREPKTIVRGLVWGVKVAGEIAIALGAAIVVMATVPVGALTALASAIALPIELTYGYLSGELRILNTLPHFRDLPTSVSTFVLGTGMTIVGMCIYKLVDAWANRIKVLQATKRFFNNSTKIAAHAIVYSALTIGLITNVVHCIETGFFSTMGLAMLLVASVGYGMLNFMKNRNNRDSIGQKAGEAVCKGIVALEITMLPTFFVEAIIGIVHQNMTALAYTLPVGVSLVVIGVAGIKLWDRLAE